MPRFLACVLALLITPLAYAQPLQTVAEKTNYRATSRHDDVQTFCDALVKRNPAVTYTHFAHSHEGRALPLLIVADPPVADPLEAKQAGKLVVLAFANIHAGEVDGKEALLALARDLTAKKGHPLLKDLVVLLVPILNADGNEKIDPKNRPGDNGPADGAGTRENAQGLDLNRDFVKLETPEVRGLVALVNKWDPALIVDCHTTNGSKHRYGLTYDGPRYPSCDTEMARWAKTALFPEVTKQVKASTGFDIAPYGNFDRERTRWESYPASPRYGVQYLALRGKLGILSESYAHASFKDRVAASKAFVTACFEVAAKEKETLAKGFPAKGERPVALRTKTLVHPEKLPILGFEEELKDGKRVATDRHKTYELAFFARVEEELHATRPHAYLVPAAHIGVIDTLRRHGIAVEELREDIELDIGAYQLTTVDTETRPFQKHNLVRVETKVRKEPRLIPAGTFVVKTDQPLGRLAAYLLEPQAEDGLTTWGAFPALEVGKDFPVLRLPRPYPLTLGAPPVLPENRIEPRKITDAVLFNPAGGFSFGLQGTPVTPGAWLDADHFLQTKEGKLWKADARTGKAELFADPEKIVKSFAALKEVTAAAAEKVAKGTFFRFNPDRTAFLYESGSSLGLVYFDGRPAVWLSKDWLPGEFLTFSPDGKRLAFVRGANLFSIDVEKLAVTQLTHDGGGDILNAKADWVYEEEIFNRNGQTFWWSPDGSQLAFMRFDDAPVRRFNIVNLNGVRGQLETYPYPKSGDPNPLVKIGVVPAAGGKPAFLDMTGYTPEEIIVARVGWLPNSKAVYAYVLNRTQTWLDFVVWDTPDAKPRKVFRETTKAWVEDLGPPRFLPDGSFLFLSDRTGWRHLYHYAADGKLHGPATTGDWDVKDVMRVDGDTKTVYFTAAKFKSTMTDFCRVKLGGEVELLTQKGKSHRVSLAPSGPLFIDRATDPMTPLTSAVCEAGKEGTVRVLDTNPVREKKDFKFGKYERVQIPMKDGFEIEGSLTYPPDFDANKKYPVWIFTYAGPHMPTIRDEWGGGRMMDNSLATSGIIIFRVDPRSASGKGAQSAWACYKQLGVQELKDLEEAVAWLGKNEYIDKTRVGISGHSYGGFMAAFALTHSKVFSAGVASGPVTDWKLYDTIYTERYMLTPKENADGYAKTSCVGAAKNLNGKLLIVHGMIDDNVHMQNSAQFAHALQLANKDFEMMFYPQSRHGIGSQHYLRLQLEFIRRTMGVKKE